VAIVKNQRLKIKDQKHSLKIKNEVLVKVLILWQFIYPIIFNL